VLVFLMEHRESRLDAMTDALWQDRSKGSQAANLHSAIYRLRTKLGRETIVRTEAGYAIPLAFHVRYDVDVFRDAVSRIAGTGNDESLSAFDLAGAALSMYGSGFLTESASAWVTRVRSDLERGFILLSDWYAQACVDRGQLDAAIGIAKNALKVEPYSDGLNGIMLEALAKAGRLSELSTAYDHYVAELREDLGIDPPRLLRETYASLLSSLVD